MKNGLILTLAAAVLTGVFIVGGCATPPADEETTPQTVTDFLKQPRPGTGTIDR